MASALESKGLVIFFDAYASEWETEGLAEGIRQGLRESEKSFGPSIKKKIHIWTQSLHKISESPLSPLVELCR